MNLLPETPLFIDHRHAETTSRHGLGRHYRIPRYSLSAPVSRWRASSVYGSY
jgi:hypothetical protein